MELRPTAQLAQPLMTTTASLLNGPHAAAQLQSPNYSETVSQVMAMARGLASPWHYFWGSLFNTQRAKTLYANAAALYQQLLKSGTSSPDILRIALAARIAKNGAELAKLITKRSRRTHSLVNQFHGNVFLLAKLKPSDLNAENTERVINTFQAEIRSKLPQIQQKINSLNGNLAELKATRISIFTLWSWWQRRKKRMQLIKEQKLFTATQTLAKIMILQHYHGMINQIIDAQILPLLKINHEHLRQGVLEEYVVAELQQAFNNLQCVLSVAQLSAEVNERIYHKILSSHGQLSLSYRATHSYALFRLGKLSAFQEEYAWQKRNIQIVMLEILAGKKIHDCQREHFSNAISYFYSMRKFNDINQPDIKSDLSDLLQEFKKSLSVSLDAFLNKNLGDEVVRTWQWFFNNLIQSNNFEFTSFFKEELKIVLKKMMFDQQCKTSKLNALFDTLNQQSDRRDSASFYTDVANQLLPILKDKGIKAVSANIVIFLNAFKKVAYLPQHHSLIEAISNEINTEQHVENMSKLFNDGKLEAIISHANSQAKEVYLASLLSPRRLRCYSINELGKCVYVIDRVLAKNDISETCRTALRRQFGRLTVNDPQNSQLKNWQDLKARLAQIDFQSSEGQQLKTALSPQRITAEEPSRVAVQYRCGKL